MKAVVVEDKEYIRKGLINLLGTVDKSIDVVAECESVQEAIVVTKTCKPQIVFLDINLTDGTAFDFLDQLDEINFKIIFITAYEEFALKALKIGTVDYLMKPVDIDELENALNKIKKVELSTQKKQIEVTKTVFEDAPDKLILSLQDSYQVVHLDELVYCESDKGYTTFYLNSGEKYIASKTLKEFEEQLLNHNFNRPHQSFMVNLKFIDKYDKSGTIHLKNGAQIPVSFRKKDGFLRSFLGGKK